jgi:hypothetical protein
MKPYSSYMHEDDLQFCWYTTTTLLYYHHPQPFFEWMIRSLWDSTDLMFETSFPLLKMCTELWLLRSNIQFLLIMCLGWALTNTSSTSKTEQHEYNFHLHLVGHD